MNTDNANMSNNNNEFYNNNNMNRTNNNNNNRPPIQPQRKINYNEGIENHLDPFNQ